MIFLLLEPILLKLLLLLFRGTFFLSKYLSDKALFILGSDLVIYENIFGFDINLVIPLKVEASYLQLVEKSDDFPIKEGKL